MHLPWPLFRWLHGVPRGPGRLASEGFGGLALPARGPASGEGTPNRTSRGRSGLPIQSRRRPVRFVSPQVANLHRWDLIVHASTPNPTKLISGVSRSLSNIDR